MVTTVVDAPDPRVYVRVELLTIIEVVYPLPAASVDEAGEPVLIGMGISVEDSVRAAALLLEAAVAATLEVAFNK